MSVRLKEWVSYNHNEEEMRKLNYNMSKTMRYIHDKGYYIKTFNPKEIEIINPDTLSPIQYNTLIKSTPKELDDKKREDIYNLAFMQIGLYSDMLNNLKPWFLKENFEEFKFCIPEEDYPYYEGVIVRNANVYYYEFIDEKNKRDIRKLQEETGVSNNKVSSFQKSKATSIGKAMTDKETRKLYSPIDKPEAAFVSFLILPIAMILLGIILSIVALIS